MWPFWVPTAYVCGRYGCILPCCHFWAQLHWYVAGRGAFYYVAIFGPNCIKYVAGRGAFYHVAVFGPN